MDHLDLVVGSTAAVVSGLRFQATGPTGGSSTARGAALRAATGRDRLTSLPTRAAFLAAGGELVGDPHQLPLVGVTLDIDGLRDINAALGYSAGDEVLVEVAARLTECVEGCLVARLGGDDFAGLISSAGRGARWPYLVVEKLAARLAEPIEVSAGRLVVTASIGLAPVQRPTALSDVLHRASRAMARAKSTRSWTDGLAAAIDMGPEAAVRPTSGAQLPVERSAERSPGQHGAHPTSGRVPVPRQCAEAALTQVPAGWW